MSIGATDGDTPDYVQDGDLMSLDEMRGAMRDFSAAKASLGGMATVRGVLTELGVVKDQMAKMQEQNTRLTGLYQTLQGEFNLFKQQRAVELHMKVNGGSTSPEDN